MATMIVDAIVSSLVDNLISIVLSLGAKFQLFEGKQDHVIVEIKRWQTNLDDLRYFLKDAEEKKQDNPGVRCWLQDVEELVYDAEDIIEEFNYQAIRRQKEFSELPQQPRGSYRWKMPCFPMRHSTCWPNSKMTGKLDVVPQRLEGVENWANSKMASKLDTVTQRLQSLKGRIESLNLLQSLVTMPTKQRWSRDPSVSLPTELTVFGRDEEKEIIKRMLFTQKQGQPRIIVIPIVGMGGLGKTTLARCIYNDPQIAHNFDVRGWVCVSADYNSKKISKEILESVLSDCGEVANKSLDWIQSKLGEALRNKKFLIVLDDNWNDKYVDWDALQPPFLQGSLGSCIIVTTRSHNVADMVRTVDSIIPRKLSDEDCWSLLCSHAGLDQNAISFLSLEEVGIKIARKCSGLPLAAMSVGGLLRNKMRVEDWKAVLDSKFWRLKDGRLDVMSVLMMSYEDLDSQLKRCFSFLSLFPEDCRLDENEVVLLWVGAGLIQLEEEEKSKKEMGHKFFHGLISRSLLSPRSDIYGSYFVMHDLVRDVALQVSKRNLHIGQRDKLNQINGSYHHLSFHQHRFDQIVEMIAEQKDLIRLRIMLSSPCLGKGELVHPVKVAKISMEHAFVSLKYIRVLYLANQGIKELPESICQMTFLRYLDVTGSYIRRLPCSITLLYNLEILILTSCIYLEQLPERIENLTNLFYLNVAHTNRLTALPGGIKELKMLRNLSNFVIGEQLPISYLGSLNLLQGSLEISNLQNVVSPEDARLAQLSDKKLEELTLKWDWAKSEVQMKSASDILEQLQPHQDLKVLTIWHYGGSILPTWMTSSLRYLVVLKIKRCNCSCSFEALASLQELRIVECPEMVVFLRSMSWLKVIHIAKCKEVSCSETFSLDSLESVVIELEPERMSPLFKEKVRLGSCHAKFLRFGCFDFRSALARDMIPHWTLPSISLTGDEFSSKMKVQTLVVDMQDSLVHLPKWISNAPSLKTLKLKDCPSLKILLPDEEELPRSTHELHIVNCPLLAKKIHERDQQLCSLISYIPSIEVGGCLISLL